MGEAFKVVAVVKFNDSEALVLNRPIEFVYTEVGKSFVGIDGPFRDFLKYGSSFGMKAFAGRMLHLKMVDGSTRDIKNDWWDSGKEGYISATTGDVEALRNCYVYSSANITPEDYASLRGQYTGPVYPYWEYEKIIKYDSERKLWIGKCCDAEKKFRDRNKRDKLIANLLMGRSILLRAIGHLNNHERIKDLYCELDEIDGEELDHIGKWKAEGKEHGFSKCDDEEVEMIECSLCGAQYAAYKAKRILKSRIGRINGILTRMGNKMREKEK